MRSDLTRCFFILIFTSALMLCCFLMVPGAALANKAGGRIHRTSENSGGDWAAFLASRKPVLPATTFLGEGLLDFFQRMGDSSWSTGLHESRYAYDLIESVHVWTLCLFFGLTVMFDLRLLGWVMREVPVSEVARRLLPWTTIGFVIMVISGAVLFSAIPLRSYQSVFFRAKMLMLFWRAECVDLSLGGVPAGRKVGSRQRAPEICPSCRRSFSSAVDRNRPGGKNDCVQLVRL